MDMGQNHKTLLASEADKGHDGAKDRAGTGSVEIFLPHIGWKSPAWPGPYQASPTWPYQAGPALEQG